MKTASPAFKQYPRTKLAVRLPVCISCTDNDHISEEPQMKNLSRTALGNSARRRPLLLLFLATAFAHSVPSAAQSASSSAYPNHQIQLVVPYGAGTGADGLARLITPKMSELLGQPIVIVNKAGGSATIGANFVAKSPPDGYTLLLGSTPSNAIAPSLDKNLSYDPIKDFQAVARVVSYPYVLAVSTTLPVRSVKELIDYAKERPGVLNYGSTGEGTGVQLAGALFNSRAGVNLMHVPYNSMGQMVGDLATGTIHIIFYPYQALIPLIQSGKMRVIAATGAKRSPSLPDVPTMAEQGVPDYDIVAWMALNAPADTPADRIQALYDAIRKTVLDPKVAARLGEAGYDVDLADPVEYAEFTKREVARYRQLIQATSKAASAAR